MYTLASTLHLLLNIGQPCHCRHTGKQFFFWLISLCIHKIRIFFKVRSRGIAFLSFFLLMLGKTHIKKDKNAMPGLSFPTNLFLSSTFPRKVESLKAFLIRLLLTPFYPLTAICVRIAACFGRQLSKTTSLWISESELVSRDYPQEYFI